MSERTHQDINTSSVIEEEHIQLLEKLSNACAVSGDEREVRNIIREQLESCADEMTVDALGNLLVRRKANVENPIKVMLSAHMDEVGFMLVEDDKNGIFRFVTVGGIDVRHIVGKVVLVGRDHRAGVIGACPIHLVDDDDLDRIIPIESMRIDLGIGSCDDVKPGDRAAFATNFQHVGSTLFGKAFDNRLGVAILIELIKRAPYAVELLASFTVQEEVGLRGAGVAAYSFEPDLAIAIDATPAYETPPWDDEDNIFYNTRLREGPAIYVADRATLSDSRLITFFVDQAQSSKIPYQMRQPGGGGTDAGAIHMQRSGIPSISISVPARYPHSPVMVACYEDWLNTLTLLQTSLNNITSKILSR